MPQRTGIGYDVHRIAKGRPLVLGGVTFESDWGLEGHSDADALMHAICDALLGAVSLGDLGEHFPPGEDRWKDAPGSELLRLVAAMVEGHGGKVVNVDSTVIAEEPKLLGYRTEMRRNIAQAIRVGFDQVSVKATTHEQLGTLGRREGIAALAIATVETP